MGLNVFDCIFSRRSTRGFRKDPVEDKLIGVMLYSAIHAPSAGNNQEWVFIVVKDFAQKRRLAEAALGQGFIAEAPAVVVVCFDKDKASLHYGKRGETLYALQDTAAASMNMLLAAEALGLKTCWVGAFDEEAVGHTLELPREVRPVAIIPVGYSDEVPQKPRRIPFENSTFVETFGKKYEIAYSVQPEGGKEYRFKPLGTYLEEFVRRNIEERESDRKERPPNPERPANNFDCFLGKLMPKKSDDDEEEHF
jgi:nitroreductase